MSTHTTTHNEHHSAKADLGFVSVYESAYAHFKKALGPILSLFAFFVLFTGALMLFSGAVLFGLYTILPATILVKSVLLALLVAVALIILIAATCISIMNIHLIVHPTYDFLPLAKKSLTELPNYLMVGLVAGLAVLGGFILLIIPGLWLTIVFYFVSFIAVLEKKDSHNSLVTSSHLVKNHFWKIALFVASLTILSMLAEYVLYIGWILQIFVGIFTLTVAYELYNRLSEHNRIHTVHSVADKKIVTISTIFIGVTVCVVAAVFAALVFFTGTLASLTV